MKRRRVIRTAEVTIETEENIVLRTLVNGRAASDRPGAANLGWCPSCRHEVEMLTPGRAAQIARVTERTIYRWVEAGRVHFCETANELILVCRSSLLNLDQGSDL